MIDFKRAFEDQLRANVNRLIAQAKKDGATGVSFGGLAEGRPELDPVIRINFGSGQRDTVHATYKRYSDYELRLVEDEDDHFSAGAWVYCGQKQVFIVYYKFFVSTGLTLYN